MKELIAIQKELKAPKNQRNNFGGYNYRSCEDILEAVKPLCDKYQCLLILSDKLVAIDGRYYIEASATIQNEEGKTVTTKALAREQATKKGMDEAQITGAASSYARKYALNGLFCIDDTKDADTDAYTRQGDAQPAKNNGARQGGIQPPAKAAQPAPAPTPAPQSEKPKPVFDAAALESMEKRTQLCEWLHKSLQTRPDRTAAGILESVYNIDRDSLIEAVAIYDDWKSLNNTNI